MTTGDHGDPEALLARARQEIAAGRPRRPASAPAVLAVTVLGAMVVVFLAVGAWTVLSWIAVKLAG